MEHEIFLRIVVWDCPAILRHLKEEPFTGDATNPPFPLSQGRENRTSLSEESIAKEHSRRDHEEHSDGGLLMLELLFFISEM